MPKTYVGIFQEYLKTREKQGGTFSPNTLRNDFSINGFEVDKLNSFECLVLFMDFLSDGFPDLAKKFKAKLQINHLGEYGSMLEKATMMMLEVNIIHSNPDFTNEVLVDPEVEKYFRDKGLQNLYETTAAMIGGKELEELKNKDKKEPEPSPETGEKREEKKPEPKPETEKKYAFRSLYELAEDGKRLRGNLKRTDPRFDLSSTDAPEFGTNLNTPMEKLIFVGQMARYAEKQENINGGAPDGSLRDISRVILESNGTNATALKGTLQKKLFTNLNCRSLLEKDLDLAEKFFEGNRIFVDHPEKKTPLRDLLDEVKASIELVRDDPARQDLTKAPVEKAPEQPAAAERQPDRKSEDVERQAALLREENLPAGPNKQMIIQESVQGDPGQRRYYDDALKAALRRAGLTEQELINNNDARIQRSRSPEFHGVVNFAAMARDTICHYDSETLGEHMKGMVDACIKYLKKYPKVRSTQSGRDSYELALNLLALSADPGDPKVRECIEKVNAARGAKPGTKNFIDLGDYGPDRLLGRKVPAGEYMKDVDKRIAEQLKRSKDKSLTPNDMIKAKYEASRLKMERLYLKTAVTPSKTVYPDRIAEETKKLMFDRQLMDEMDAHQSEKEQEQIMREHLASETASVPQPKTTQKEKQQDAPVAGK